MHDQSQLQFLKPEKELLGTSKEYDLNVGFEDRVESEYIYWIDGSTAVMAIMLQESNHSWIKVFCFPFLKFYLWEL